MRSDDTTPREVYEEYEAYKRGLDQLVCARVKTIYVQRDQQLARFADLIGIGLLPAELSDAQRERQAEAIARWSTRCSP